jgi:hypothetical protein
VLVSRQEGLRKSDEYPDLVIGEKRLRGMLFGAVLEDLLKRLPIRILYLGLKAVSPIRSQLHPLFARSKCPMQFD